MTLFIWARYRGRDGAPLFLIPLAVAGVTYLAAIRELSQTPKFARGVVPICLALSVLWRVPFLLIPAGPPDDLHRYVWDGRLQRLGYNPYTAIPADPALADLHTSETRELNNPRSSQPVSSGRTTVLPGGYRDPRIDVRLQSGLLGCDLALTLVRFGALRRIGREEHWLPAYAWNPLLATEVAGGGYIDMLACCGCSFPPRRSPAARGRWLP